MSCHSELDSESMNVSVEAVQTLKQVQGDGCTDKFGDDGNFWVVIITPFFSDNKLLNTGVLGATNIRTCFVCA